MNRLLETIYKKKKKLLVEKIKPKKFKKSLLQNILKQFVLISNNILYEQTLIQILHFLIYQIKF